MYLVLIPVHRINGARSDYYEANYLRDPIEVNRALEKDGVVVYKLDVLKEVSAINLTYKEVINGRE